MVSKSSKVVTEERVVPYSKLKVGDLCTNIYGKPIEEVVSIERGNFRVTDKFYGDYKIVTEHLETGEVCESIGTRDTSTSILVAKHIEEFEVSSGKGDTHGNL